MSRLWYKDEAKVWEEALPIGNGKIGAMVFGGVNTEHLQINEDSVWYGGPRDRNNPDALTHLPEIRNYIMGGEITKAEKLMKCALSGVPQSQRCYQTLGDIFIYNLCEKEFSEYEHSLDLDTAIDKVTYNSGGVTFFRETFISAPDNVLVMRIKSDKKGMISFNSLIKRIKFYDNVIKSENNGLIMSGNLAKEGYDFKAIIKCKSINGRVQVIGEHICVEDADESILYMTAGTTFDRRTGGLRKSVELDHELETTITKAMNSEFEHLKDCHIKDYKKLYDRIQLTIDDIQKYDAIPTDERLKSAIKNNKSDPGLSKLYFDFGRYLLISCSRPGSLPANLQGLWNKDIEPKWDSKYTININTEMNYWPAEICNLPECHLPLFDLIKRMVPNGQQTATKMYGCRGFVAHHNTDIWADTAVQDHWIPGSYWVMGAAWLCTHLWNHYEYNRDIIFLKEAFPIMREAATFFLDFLIQDGAYLKTCPSVSPENRFIHSSGVIGCNSIGVTMDNQILRDLFTQCIKAAEVLNVADTLNSDIKNALNKLMPTAIGKYGQIMEWQEDYEEADPGHRHISHLYGLYPSSQITVDQTPELAEAAKITLQRRLSNGGGHTGWSRAWIINDYVKLWDAKNASYNLDQLLIKSTLPNMLDNHPPFQIDGNLGATAAIGFMLVQSTTDRIIILPALPECWKTGQVQGLKVKGCATIDISWENSVLKNCTIHAQKDFKSTLYYEDRVYEVDLSMGSSYSVNIPYIDKVFKVT